MNRFVFLLVIAMAAAASGQDQIPAIVWPVTVDPVVQPVVQPEPAAVSKIPFDQAFVIACRQRMFAFASPMEIADVTESAGPVTIVAVFAGGSGKRETRVFDAPWVYLLEPKKPGKVEIILVPYEAKEPAGNNRQTVEITGPRPGPDPVKPVDPVEPVEPKPVEPVKEFGKLQVLIVEETEDRSQINLRKPGQLTAMLSVAVREYMKTHGLTAADGTPDFRKLDKDQDVLSPNSKQPAWLKTAWKTWQDSGAKTPFVVLSNGKRGIACPVPDSEEEFLELLKQYGGE